MAKPSLPQGTRDFGPDVVRKRNFILDTIKNVFELYGFQPLETPAMENIETLMGKYGEEGDKLIFRILDSGNPFSDNFFKEFFKSLEDYNERIKDSFTERQGIPVETGPFDLPLLEIDPEVFNSYITDFLNKKDQGGQYISKLKNETSEKALRYDLTIPFARYVAMNHNKLVFPFKRYQVQPVWRADRPQRGRYREFYQCDVDVVGSNSLLNEIELATIYATVFEKLKLNVKIKINSRKILTALAETCDAADKLTDITVAIDKLDKIGLDKVKQELSGRQLSGQQIDIIEKYLLISTHSGDNETILKELQQLFADKVSGNEGLKDLRHLLDNTSHLFFTSKIIIDPTLARGLNYYTGCIFEVVANDVKIGSIGGGGRYDDLTGLFGVPHIPGVGISFGVDRIYDVMEELNLFPADVHVGTQVLFFNLGEKESQQAFALVQQLRQKGVRTELYHEQAKFDKQFKYAEKKNIPYVVIIGEKELQSGTCNLKNIVTGDQQTISTGELLNQSF